MNACHHINDTPTKTFNLLGKKKKRDSLINTNKQYVDNKMMFLFT